MLQRMLGCHPEITTQSEYWFLLPHIMALRGEHTYAAYSANTLKVATEALLEQLPDGRSGYEAAIRSLGNSLYSQLATGGERYVLDKTPRYYLIIEDIRRIFPDAKLIFLFRNPPAVAASIVSSFHSGRMGNVRHRIDVFEGPKHLARGYNSVRESSIAVQYERLVTDPKAELKRICDYLDIEFVATMLEDFGSVPVVGLGDMFGSNRHKTVSTSAVDRWKEVFGTPYRRRYLRKYLDYLGPECVETMGYDFGKLRSEVEDLPVRFEIGFIDWLYELRGKFMSTLEIPLLRQKIKDTRARRGKYFIHY